MSIRNSLARCREFRFNSQTRARNCWHSRLTSSLPWAVSAWRRYSATTRSVPIVFVQVVDPVGGGFVESLARPGGNVTGFTNFEYGLGGKWLEPLKEIAPRVTRAAVLRDPGAAAGTAQIGAIQAAAPSLGVEVKPINVRDAAEIERALAAFARDSNGGLIVPAGAATNVHRDIIVALAALIAARHLSVPRYVDAGGLISYGSDTVEQYRRAAGYVDRILRGRSPPTCRCSRRRSTSW